MVFNMFPYSISFLLIFTRLCSTKPLNEGDILFPDEMELFAKIFSNNTNIVSDISVQNKKIEEIEVEPVNVNMNMSFGNRYLINVPCQKGTMRIGHSCRRIFEK
ncbi:hypothetical protein WA026_019134 [Henosepilachna vigintioctopunctata]|uniref:Uncharacterized protein n=1 Tax=Henosepilachna vigintioctopunctata TaxID=420089 RepID=A0AAW1V433_9CUCU